MILGAYHCLYAPHGISVNLADLLAALISWVQHGIAPGTIEADTWPAPWTRSRSIRRCGPTTPLLPVTPAPGSLNVHYHYLGAYH